MAQTREGERETVGEEVASWCVRLRQGQQLLVASLEIDRDITTGGIANVVFGKV